MAMHLTKFVKLVVVGDGGVGKTSMLNSYCENTFDDNYEPTVFDNYSCTVLADGFPVTLSLWDTAGQEDFDRLRGLSYAETDVFLVCYSLVNPTSLANVVSKWVPEVKLGCPSAKIILCGTKSDLRYNARFVGQVEAKGKKVVGETEAEAVAASLGVPAFVCSARTQKGLKRVFDAAVASALGPTTPPAPKPLAPRALMMSALRALSSRAAHFGRRRSKRRHPVYFR